MCFSSLSTRPCSISWESCTPLYFRMNLLLVNEMWKRQAKLYTVQRNSQKTSTGVFFGFFANAGWFPVQSVFTCLNWDYVMQGSWRWKFWLNHRACNHVSCFLNCVFLCSHLKPEWDVIDSSVHQSNHWHPASGLYIVSSPPQRRPHSLVDTDVCFMSFYDWIRPKSHTLFNRDFKRGFFL